MVAAGWTFLPFAAVRLANAAFALATAAYCVLSYSPFAYEQFIRPQLVGWLPGAIAAHHRVFWILLAVTLASLAPHLRRRQPLAWGYAAAGGLAGSWLAASLATACSFRPAGSAARVPRCASATHDTSARVRARVRRFNISSHLRRFMASTHLR